MSKRLSLTGYPNSLKGFKQGMIDEIAGVAEDKKDRLEKKESIIEDITEMVSNIMELKDMIRCGELGLLSKFSKEKCDEIEESIKNKIDNVNAGYEAIKSMDIQLKIVRYQEKKFRYLHNLDIVNAEKYASKVMWLHSDILDEIDGELDMKISVSGYNDKGERETVYSGSNNSESAKQFADSMMECKRTDEGLIRVAKQYI